jgi:hypothetical protein
MVKNEWITTPHDYTKDDDFYVWQHFFLNIRVKNTSRIPLQGDSNFAAGFPHSYDTPATYRLHGPVDGGGGETNRWNLDRHRLSVNLVFLDWSVRKVGLRQLWEIRWNREINNNGASNWGNLSIVPDWRDPMQWPEWMRQSQNYDL